MTAEIAILNREAVALAADSAVSRGGGRKVFPSANKIFMLSKRAPVGIMVYGSATFMGTPWETVIKVYRERLGTLRFDGIEEYASDFLAFLENEPRLAPQERAEGWVRGIIVGAIIQIREETDRIIDQVGIPEEFQKGLRSAFIDRRFNFVKGLPLPASVPEDAAQRVRRDFSDTITQVKDYAFPSGLITQPASMRLREIAVNTVVKMVPGSPAGISGVVVAGFGEHSLFPSLCSYEVEGILFEALKCRSLETVEIGHGRNAEVVPFAQGDMVHLFLHGVDPGYSRQLRRFVIDALAEYPKKVAEAIKSQLGDEEAAEALERHISEVSDRLMKQYLSQVEEKATEDYKRPILSVIEMLPKGELAVAAETLVNLTSFKQRVSDDEAETVGGPIDVAIISKGDGFVWIERKHYFRPELNHHFFENYFQHITETRTENGESEHAEE